jgi:hypothetical protein
MLANFVLAFLARFAVRVHLFVFYCCAISRLSSNLFFLPVPDTTAKGQVLRVRVLCPRTHFHVVPRLQSLVFFARHSGSLRSFPRASQRIGSVYPRWFELYCSDMMRKQHYSGTVSPRRQQCLRFM